jgi:hypothetical protein
MLLLLVLLAVTQCQQCVAFAELRRPCCALHYPRLLCQHPRLDGLRLLGVLLSAVLVANELRSPPPSCCLLPTAHTDAVLSLPATLWEALLGGAAWWLLLLLLLLVVLV